MSQRFFAFGCSFTQYHWPTWADIIGKQSDFYQNWGKTGAGNQYIFNALIECQVRNTLTKDDLVCVMFTNFCREDRYVGKSWITPGNIFTQTTYDKKFVKNFADVRGYYIRDLATIYAIDKVLTAIGCKKFYFSMVDIVNPLQYEHSDFSSEVSDLFGFYQPIIDKILPSVHNVVFDRNWYSRPNYHFLPVSIAPGIVTYYHIKDLSWPECRSQDDFLNLPGSIRKECEEIFGLNATAFVRPDTYRPLQTVRDQHPVPLEHMEYLEKVAPELSINNDTKSWLQQIHQLGSTQQDYVDLLDQKIITATPTRW